MAELKSSTSEIRISRDRLAELVNEELAREYQAIIAYVVYSQTIKGAAYIAIAKELEKHAAQELQHALLISKQIDFLGGSPTVQAKPVRTSEETTDMLNRRDLLLASIAAGVAVQNRNALAKPSQPTTPVNFDVPAGACDCHTHIHGDPEKFPFFAGRVYTPEPASPEEMAALHKAVFR